MIRERERRNPFKNLGLPAKNVEVGQKKEEKRKKKRKKSEERKRSSSLSNPPLSPRSSSPPPPLKVQSSRHTIPLKSLLWY
jgi:hypothetical protein